MRIGIDVMGSDRSPHVLFEAVIQAAKQLPPSITLIVIVNEEFVKQFSEHLARVMPNDGSVCAIQFCIAHELIEMRDNPLISLRSKKRSSLVIGLKLLKKKAIDAFVTAGNTGALIAGSRLLLPALPHIKRPALLAVLPTQKGKVAIIDVGGNVSCKVQHLIQFAEMGVAYMQCSENIQLPKVGLLNIGIESKKGTANVQQAYQILEDQHKENMHFIGNIEGRDVFKGEVDVLVTDGFTGNVLLKTSEGVAHLILDYMKKNLSLFNNSHLQPAFQELQHHFNYAEYPGAIVLGVEGIVIKCHGDASTLAMLHSIKGAFNLLQNQLINKIKETLK